MTERIIFEIAVPVLMLVVGWLTNAYRNKQKKEADILDNVKQIIDMQKEHITQCEKRIEERDATLSKLEAKYDHKVRAVKEAYNCEYDTSHCPVAIYDKKVSICDTCEHKPKPRKNDTQQDSD